MGGLSNVTRADAWLQSSIPIRPGGGSDDAPRMAAAYANGVATGRAVVLEAGVYQWASPQELPRTGPAPLIVWACPGVEIVSTLPADGMEANAPFNSNPSPPGTVTTLVADAVKGSPVLQLVDASDASLAPGNFIRVEVDPPTVLRLATYFIVARDLGANTITVERPVRRTFAAGSLVTPWRPLKGFRLYGNGIVITGTGDRGIEVVGGWDCYVADVLIDGEFQDFVCGYDLGSTRCVFERVRVNGNGNAFACVAFENSELCELRTGWLWNTAPSTAVGALLLPGAVDFVATNVRAWGSLLGLNCTVNDPSNTEGGDNISIAHSSFYGCTSDGVAIRDGSTNVTLTDVAASFNAANGVHVYAGGNGVAPQRVRCLGLRVEGNANYGLFGDAPSDIEVSEIATLDNGIGEVVANLGATISVIGANIRDTSGPDFKSLVLSRAANSLIRMTRAHIEATGTNNLQLCEAGTTANLALDDCSLAKGGIEGILLQATGGGEISVRKVTTVGGNYPVLLDTGGVLHLDHETDLSAGNVPQSRIDVTNAGVFVVDAPGLAGIQVLALPAGGVMYPTWDQWYAGVLQFTTGLAVGATAIGVPPVRTRQRIVNSSAVAITILAVDQSGTPIGGGPTLAPSASADVIFDGSNVLQVS